MDDHDTTQDSPRLAGARGEAIAARHLEAQGVTIVARNYRCRGGELDLARRDGATLVFVEVRSRKSRAFGGAAASITARKQARVVRAAQHYLAVNRLGDRPCRFDCVLIDAGRLEWLRDAFAAD